MGKDKRGLGERSTNEAPIAPKLHKRLHRRRAVRSEYIKGMERRDVCIHDVAEGFDRLVVVLIGVFSTAASAYRNKGSCFASVVS